MPAVDVVARSGESALLLMLDIDHFKRINDTHGHLAGDQVLQAMAKCLSGCLRPMDTVARYGGEEFAVVMPNCQLYSTGQPWPNVFDSLWNSSVIAVTPSVTVRITISIGGAYAPEWVRSTSNLWTNGPMCSSIAPRPKAATW